MGRPKGSKNKPKLPEPMQDPVPDAIPPTAISVPPAAWSIDDWKNNVGIQHQLQVLLDDPIMRMAFHSLLVQGLPCSRAAVVPGVSAEAMTLYDSQRLHNRSGFTGFYKALHNLARLKNAPEPKAGWGTKELLEEDE
jgi:hypothetical protein